MLESHIDISFWAQASWTQRMLRKLIQDQSWPLSKAAGLVYQGLVGLELIIQDVKSSASKLSVR
jgi:hypothetical protein